MLTAQQAKDLVKKAISYSTFPGCDVSVSSTERASIRFALNGITTSGFTLAQSMSITAEKEGRSGSTTIDEFDDKSLREAVQRTEKLALISPPNPEREPPIGPQKYPALENFDSLAVTDSTDERSRNLGTRLIAVRVHNAPA